MMNKTLYCDISSHGFGHVAQSAPILNLLHRLRPDIEIVIQCGADPKWLAGNFKFKFEHVRHSSDFGMVMENALSVDVWRSHQRYSELHQRWQEEVSELAMLMAQYQPHACYNNISYLGNAAAAHLSLPVINLCSLNWYGVYKHYCEALPGAKNIMSDMLVAYQYATVFLAPQPSMPMPELEQVNVIGTVARRGKKRAAEIRQQYGLAENARLVLISHGGVGLDINFHVWPEIDNTYFLVSTTGSQLSRWFIQCDSLGMPHIDIMSSCDAIVTKAGYGTYAEAACQQIPVIYTQRDDWPEEVFLNEWLHEIGCCLEISITELQSGQLQDALTTVLGLEKKIPVKPTGIESAVGALLQYF